MSGNRLTYQVTRLWLALLLVAAQGTLFAHSIDELADPAQTVCDLCVTGHSVGASAVPAELHWAKQQRGGHCDPVPASPVVSSSAFTPSQRAPPVSR